MKVLDNCINIGLGIADNMKWRKEGELCLARVLYGCNRWTGSLPSPAPLRMAPLGPFLGTHFGTAACYTSLDKYMN